MIRQPQQNASLSRGDFSAFELELNALIRRHFPHWEARDLRDLGAK